MTASNLATVVRLNPSSTRRSVSSTPITCILPSDAWSSCFGAIGKDHEEGRTETGVHFVQVQTPDYIEAMQAVCSLSLGAEWVVNFS